ncbi:MAG TPA: DNA topoisomerase IB [Streptosporangiaceae bacterium]|nr:DNA topoisomerase IB [Streptosporangiaceae bacterium]
MTGPAAVPGLNRSDVRGPGLARVRAGTGFRYLGADGAEISDSDTLRRIRALALPPAWTGVWISPDALGHIQATGIDSRGRTQYRYHELWRQQRDEQKYEHMLRFAAALPRLRDTTLRDLGRRPLDRGRVAAAAVRLMDLGLFRLGGERYAELDHHYGAVTLEKHHVTIRRDGLHFDYVGKEGKERAITVTDAAVLPTVRALARADNGLSALFCFRGARSAWYPMHSHDVSAYIADNSGGHFTAKEFRTWNATLLMALLLAAAGPPASERAARTAIRESIRGVAQWLGDTPTVARASYIDPRIVSYYESGNLARVPIQPARLPVDESAEQAVAALLAAAVD